ncbi:ABC transporter permease [Taklimakanibacter deserti]|uniref:ABC transporter permease n=1 Tax=Taklimakanibacter deserti TaxID=2267839 RepID=UPI000E6589FD
MATFLAKRLAMMLVTMVAASFLVFAVCEFTPGSVARKSLGPFATQEQVDLLTQKLKADDPLVVRYGRWAGVLLGIISDPLQDPSTGLNFTDPRGARYFGNFGYSTLNKLPVNDVIWDRLGNTAILGGLAFMLIVPLSILFGVLSGLKEGGILDRSLSVVSITFTSIPEFASGVFLVTLFVILWPLLPGTSSLDTGSGWSIPSQLVLPVAVLVIYDFGYVARMIRVSMIGVMEKPYIRTAVLKGMSTRQVVLGHALRNAMIAPFTVLLLQINFLISGVVVTELVFAYPGFGRLLLDASLFGDIATIEAATLITVAIAVTTQFIGDLGYMLLDPRIRLR